MKWLTLPKLNPEDSVKKTTKRKRKLPIRDTATERRKIAEKESKSRARHANESTEQRDTRLEATIKNSTY